MRIRAAVGIVLLSACVAAAYAEDRSKKSTSAAEPSPVFVGEVVKLTPGHAIVIRSGDGKEVTYTLVPTSNVPTGVKVGSNVNLYAEPDGTTVKRIVINAVTPTGEQRRLTEEIRVKPTGEAETVRSAAIVSGTVTHYVAGKSITVRKPDGTEVTYGIDVHSVLPANVEPGSHVSVTPTQGRRVGEQQTVRRAVYTKSKGRTRKTG
jgi:hypothetical protein